VHLTALASKPLALIILLALLGAWFLRSRRRLALKLPAMTLSFVLVVAGWVGLHEVPPLGWALILTGCLLPLAATRRRPPEIR